jgi:hypothetical protein
MAGVIMTKPVQLLDQLLEAVEADPDPVFLELAAAWDPAWPRPKRQIWSAVCGQVHFYYRGDGRRPARKGKK